MPTVRPIPKRFWRRSSRPALMVFLAVFSLTVIALVTTTARKDSIIVGSTFVRLKFDESSTQTEFFFHTTWDGPTGEFSSGRFFGLRLPGGALEFSLEHNPLEVIRRRLPNSTTELTKLLRSRNHFEVWCAAEALAKKKEAAAVALPDLLAAAEKQQIGPTAQAIEDIALAAPKAAVPVLMQFLESTNRGIALHCAEILGKFGTNGVAAAPVLMLQLHAEQERLLRLQFADAYFKVSGDFAPAIPLLRDVLQTASPIEKQGVLFQLRSYGTNAAALIPEIRALVSAGELPPHLNSFASASSRNKSRSIAESARVE